MNREPLWSRALWRAQILLGIHDLSPLDKKMVLLILALWALPAVLAFLL